MSSDDENYSQTSNEITEELNIMLINEEFQELFAYLQKIQKECHSKSKNLVYSSYKILIKNNHYVQALELMLIYTELLELGLPNQILIDKYFELAKSGDTEELQKLISVFGFYPGLQSSNGLNLFTEAAYSGKYSMMKFLREELGVESREEHIMIKAAGLGNKTMMKYLYEDMGVEVSNEDILIRTAIESGCIECLKYARHYMNIYKLSDYKILETAIHQTVLIQNFKILDFLLTHFVIDFEPSHIPPFRRNNLRQKSLHESLQRAVISGNLNIISYLVHVAKLKLSTDNPESELNCYLEFLQIAARTGNFDMLKILIEEAQLEVTLLPKLYEEDLMVTVMNSKIDYNLKRKIIDYLNGFNQNLIYDTVIAKLEEQEPNTYILSGPYKKIKIDCKK